jgi:hypothetical protein
MYPENARENFSFQIRDCSLARCGVVGLDRAIQYHVKDLQGSLWNAQPFDEFDERQHTFADGKRDDSESKTCSGESERLRVRRSSFKITATWCDPNQARRRL